MIQTYYRCIKRYTLLCTVYYAVYIIRHLHTITSGIVLESINIVSEDKVLKRYLLIGTLIDMMIQIIAKSAYSVRKV